MIASPAAFAAVVQATKAFGDLSVGLLGLSMSPYLLIFVIGSVVVLFTGSPPACLMMGLGMVCGVVAGKGTECRLWFYHAYRGLYFHNL